MSKLPARWRDTVPNLEPLILIFGCQPFSAATQCQAIHPDRSDPLRLTVGQIPGGSKCTCAVCHVSGRDDRKFLKITDAERVLLAMYKPEKPDGYEPTAVPTVLEVQDHPGGVQPKRRRVLKQCRRKKAKP